MEKDLDKVKIAQSASILWDPLTDEQRDLFVNHAEVRKLERDEVIYREDETPEYLYYLLRGKVTMYRQGLSGPHIVRMVEPGAIFGYVASIEGSNYKSTAVAGADTEVLTIPVRLMFHFIWENSSFAMLFLRELSSLLGISVQRTISLTQKHIRGRLAETLLSMLDKYGVEEDGLTLAVYLSRSDMAQMANMTTSNAIRTLSAFASEGLVSIEGRKLKIINVEALQQISQRG